LLGLGKDIQDRLTQPGQRRALRLLQSIQVLIDLLGRHGPILLIAQPMSKESQLGQPDASAGQCSPGGHDSRAGAAIRVGRPVRP